MNKALIILLFLVIGCVPVKQQNVKTNDEQFTSFIEQQVAMNQDERQQMSMSQNNKQFYHLRVNAIPSNSIIKVMNIKPKYQNNMSLPQGKYDILVEKDGYKPERQWIEIRDGDITLNVTLQKAMKSFYRKSIGKYKTESYQRKPEKLGCSPKKSCGTVTSCEEAYFHLKNCGNRRMDKDKDGIPCESICSGG